MPAWAFEGKTGASPHPRRRPGDGKLELLAFIEAAGGRRRYGRGRVSVGNVARTSSARISWALVRSPAATSAGPSTGA